MNHREFAYQIVEQLRNAGYQAYWAGGCVRDLLLGIEASDYDVATNARPHEIRQIFGHARTLAVGAAFGVIIVLSPDRKHQVEVATFRTDATYSDGRHPDSIAFSTPQMDAQRRDFTINGMFYDPIADQVIDYVGGQADLENSTLRAIGDPDARIGEDKLRMLRAIRFAARFGFEIESATYRAVQRHAPEAALVSGERLSIELRKTLETRRPAWAVEKWADTGLLNVLLPEIAPSWKTFAAVVSTMLTADNPNGWMARLACILWPSVGENWDSTLVSIKSRLKFSNEESIAIRFALSSQQVLAEADQLLWSQVQPLIVSPGIQTAVDLVELRSNVGEVALRTVQWLRERLDWPLESLDPAPLINGQDLVSLGLKPGPAFKEILLRIRGLQLDQRLQTPEQVATWLRDHLSQNLND